MPTDLTIETRAHGDWTVVSVAGEVDLATAGELNRALTQAIDDGSLQVVLDLSRVGFMDSTGLRVVIAGSQRLGGEGGVLEVVAADGPVPKLFSVTGLDSIIAVRASLGEATGG